MLFPFYHKLLIISYAIIGFIGCQLCWGVVPLKLRHTSYARSRRLVGITAIFLAIELWFFSYLDIRRDGNDARAIASNLTTYFFLAELLISAISILLGLKDRYTYRYLLRSIVEWLIYSLSMWAMVLFMPKSHAMVGLVCYALVLIVREYWRASVVLRGYKMLIEKAESLYSDSLEAVIKWTTRSLFHLGVLFLLGISTAFLPINLQIYLMFYALFVFTYIYAHYINFMLHGELVMLFDREAKLESGEVVESPNALSEESIALLIERWISEKEFLNNGITIESLAEQLGSNRTYLSLYINTRYQTTFREWITQLRVNEAKARLLADGDRLSITELATSVGFSSASAFSRAFSRLEGCSPLRWREGSTRGK